MMKNGKECLSELHGELQLQIAEVEQLVAAHAESPDVLDTLYELEREMRSLLNLMEYSELETELERKLNADEKLEVDKLIGWGYGKEHCISMLYQKQTAEEYEYGLE